MEAEHLQDILASVSSSYRDWQCADPGPGARAAMGLPWTTPRMRLADVHE